MSRDRDDELINRTSEAVALGKKPKPKGVFETIIDGIILKNISDIKDTFVNEVLIPQTMEWLYGLGTNFLSDVFQTPYDSDRRSSVFSSKKYIKYGDKYESSARSRRERRDERIEDVRDYEDISFDSRQDAERVLSRMIANMRKYDGTVTISDLFAFSGLKSSWTDEKYGWTNLDKARIYRGRRDGRYYLDLPEPFPIDED